MVKVAPLLLAGVLLALSPTALASPPKKAPATKKTPRWASERNYLEAAWSPAVPVVPTNETLGLMGFGGATVGYRFRITEHFSVGARSTWHLFDDLEWEMRTVALTLPLHWYFPKARTVLPFIGLGLGATRVRRIEHSPPTELENIAWHPSVCPEVGMIVLLKRVPLLFSAGFHYSTPTPDEHGEAWVEFSFGIALPN